MNDLEKFGPTITTAQETRAKRRIVAAFASIDPSDRALMRREARHARAAGSPVREGPSAFDRLAAMSDSELAADAAASAIAARQWNDSHDPTDCNVLGCR